MVTTSTYRVQLENNNTFLHIFQINDKPTRVFVSYNCSTAIHKVRWSECACETKHVGSWRSCMCTYATWCPCKMQSASAARLQMELYVPSQYPGGSPNNCQPFPGTIPVSRFRLATSTDEVTGVMFEAKDECCVFLVAFQASSPLSRLRPATMA